MVEAPSSSVAHINCRDGSGRPNMQGDRQQSATGEYLGRLHLAFNQTDKMAVENLQDRWKRTFGQGTRQGLAKSFEKRILNMAKRLIPEEHRGFLETEFGRQLTKAGAVMIIQYGATHYGGLAPGNTDKVAAKLADLTAQNVGRDVTEAVVDRVEDEFGSIEEVSKEMLEGLDLNEDTLEGLTDEEVGEVVFEDAEEEVSAEADVESKVEVPE